MMMKKIATLILVSLVFSSFSYPQGGYKDPFEPLLPQEVKKEEERHEKIISEIEDSLPSMVVEGLLWGGDFSQVIIDGEVYRVGDRLKGIDAQVFRIEQGEVFISYGEKIYKIKIGKKEEI